VVLATQEEEESQIKEDTGDTSVSAREINHGTYSQEIQPK